MKYHWTGYGISALLHVAVLLAVLSVMLWQDDLDKPEEPVAVTLSLTQFVPAPKLEPEPAPHALPEEPTPVKPEPKPVKQPKPKPESKPVEKPKPKPKPEKKLEKKAPPKPVNKPAPKPVPRQSVAQPKPVPQRQVQAAPPTVASAVPRPPIPAPKPAQPAQPKSNPAAEAAYKRKLQGLIAARKKYPRMAQKAEIEGSVLVAFTVMPNGAITGVRVSNSSGNDWLDKAAVQAVSAASGALPFPPEIRKPSWAFSLTVNFKLDW